MRHQRCSELQLFTLTSKFYVKKGLQLNLLLYTPSNGLKTTRDAKNRLMASKPTAYSISPRQQPKFIQEGKDFYRLQKIPKPTKY